MKGYHPEELCLSHHKLENPAFFLEISLSSGFFVVSLLFFFLVAAFFAMYLASYRLHLISFLFQ